MADLSKTVELIFTATDTTGSVIRGLGSGLRDLEGSIQGVVSPFAEVTRSVLAFETAIAAVGVAVLGTGVQTAIRYAEAQADLNKALSDTTETAEDYQEEIRGISDRLNESQTTVLQLAADFANSGYSIQESLSLATAALVAVKTGEVDVADASQLLIRALEGFGFEAEQVGRVLDAVNGVSSTTAVSFRELLNGVSGIAPVTASAGASFEQMVGLLVPVITSLGSGSEAATGLRTVLLNLATPTTTVAGALDDLRISLIDSNGQQRLAYDILTDVAAAWGNLTPQVRASTAANIAGKDQADVFSAALNGWSDNIKAVGEAIAPTITATQELAVKLATPQAAVDSLRVSFEAASLAIGQQFLGEAVGAVGALDDLAASFEGVVRGRGLEPLFNVLRPLLFEFESSIRLIAQNLPAAFEGLDFSRLVSGFQQLGVSIAGLFGDLDLTTADGLREALQQLINLGGSFLQFTSGVVDGLEPMFRLLAGGADSFAGLGDSVLQASGYFAGVSTAIDTFLPVLGSLGGALEAAGGLIITLAGARQLGLLGPAFTASATAAGSLTTALGAGGLVAAVAFAASQIYDLVGAAVSLNAQWQLQDAAAAGAAQSQRDLAAEYAALSDRTGVAVTNTQEFNSAIQAGLLVYDRAQGAWVAAGQAVGQLTGDVAAGADEWTRYGAEFNNTVLPLGDGAGTVLSVADAVSRSGQAAQEAAQGFEGLGEKLVSTNEVGGYLIEVWQGQDGALRQTSRRVQDAASDANALAAAQQNLARESDEVRIKLLELATEERIARIQATVELNVAQVEADVRRVEAAFDSLNTGIDSTADVIGRLVDTLGGLEPNTRGYNDIMEIVRQEYQLREQEFELQKRMVEEQLRLMEARRQSLERGDAMVTINAEGLQQHAQAFMYEMLQEIQVRATEEGQQWLGLLSCAG